MNDGERSEDDKLQNREETRSHMYTRHDRLCHTIKASHGAIGSTPFHAEEHHSWGTWPPRLCQPKKKLGCLGILSLPTRTHVSFAPIVKTNLVFPFTAAHYLKLSFHEGYANFVTSPTQRL